MCGTSEALTACSASAFARKKRAREKVDADIAEKKTKRSTPARSAAWTIRHVATPLSSSIEPRGWSRTDAARWITVSHAAHGVPERLRIGEVAEGDLHADTLVAQAPGVTDETPDRLGPGGQPPQQRRADQTGGAGEQDHGGQSRARAICLEWLPVFADENKEP